MAVKFKLDLGTVYNKYEDNVKALVNKSLKLIYKEVMDNSPKDTGKFKRSNQIFKATRFGNSIKGSVFNSDTKGINVEFGFNKGTYNRHQYKGGPVIHTGVGARTYTKTFDNNEEEVLNILNKIKLKQG